MGKRSNHFALYHRKSSCFICLHKQYTEKRKNKKGEIEQQRENVISIAAGHSDGWLLNLNEGWKERAEASAGAFFVGGVAANQMRQEVFMAPTHAQP